MVKIKPNANFYSLGGVSVHDGQGKEYQEYRRSWIELPQEFILRDFPMHLDIEITSRCNLKCTYCDKLPVLTKERLGDMDLALYKKIIDEGAAHKLWGVKLSYRGEPLLHKDIFEMVAYAKNRGILDIYFNTNGMLLNSKTCGELIKAGLDRISISVDGADPEFFNRERVGANFDTIVENIETLMNIRRQKGVDYPKVRVQSIYFPNLDVDKYRTFWSRRCDEVAAVDYKDGASRQEGIVCDWACPQLWQRMTIEWDGTIHPCNNDDSSLMPLDNVKQKSLYEFWHDGRLREIRQLHRQGASHKVRACNGCPWRMAQIKKIISKKVRYA